MKMGDIASAEEEDDPDDIPEGFHLQEESPHCINMKRAEDYQAYLRQIVLEFERFIKSGATQHFGRIWQSDTEHVLGGKSEQADHTEWSGSS